MQIFVGLLLLSGLARGSPLPTRGEVLTRVYPEAEIRAERVFLTQAQLQRAAELAGGEIPTRLIALYRARRSGVEVGRAYVDTHVVRTKKESLLICLDAEGRVRRVEATAFLEPREYIPSRAWYDQFQDEPLSDGLRLDREIRPVAGATLTAHATTRAVRRVLAIDRVLRESPR